VYGQYDHAPDKHTLEIVEMVEPERSDLLPKRIPGLQSRAEFLTLTGLELEAFNSLRRRGQLPQSPPLHWSEEWQDAQGWSPWAALALVMALELTKRYQLSRTRAAEIASNVNAAIRRRRDICVGVREVAEGRKPKRDILFASLDLPDARPTKKLPDPTVAVGTFKELAARYPTAKGLIAVSATRCAALIHQRAKEAKIDIPNFLD
jgi:hypothetical protein